MLKLFISYLSETYPNSTLHFDDVDSVAVTFAEDQEKMCFLNMQDCYNEPVLFCVIIKDRWYCRTHQRLGGVYNTKEEIKNSIDFVMKADTQNISWKEINGWMDYCVHLDSGVENNAPKGGE